MKHLSNTTKRYQFPKMFYRLRENKLAYNISKVYIGDLISKAMAGVVTIIIIRLLSISDYAQFIAFSTVLYLFPALIGGGVNMAMIRFSAEHLSHTGKRNIDLYLISMIMQILLYLMLGIIILILSDKISGLLFGGRQYDTAMIYGLIGGFGYLTLRCGVSIYQAEEKFNQYIYFNLAVQGTKIFILTFFIAFISLDFNTASLAFIIANIFISAIIITSVFKSSHLASTLSSIKDNAIMICGFLQASGWLVAYFLVLTAFQRLDIFMLSNFSTEAELANYGVSYQYYSLLLMALGAIQSVLIPKFSKVEMADHRVQIDFVFKWLKFTWWVVIPIILVDLLGKPIFIWINGVRYERAFYIFVVFSLGVWSSLMLSPLVNVLIARKDFKVMFLIALGAFCLNFTGNYIFVPRWGGLAAAIVTISSVAFVGIMLFARIWFSTNRR